MKQIIYRFFILISFFLLLINFSNAFSCCLAQGQTSFQAKSSCDPGEIDAGPPQTGVSNPNEICSIYETRLCCIRDNSDGTTTKSPTWNGWIIYDQNVLSALQAMSGFQSACDSTEPYSTTTCVSDTGSTGGVNIDDTSNNNNQNNNNNEGTNTRGETSDDEIPDTVLDTLIGDSADPSNQCSPLKNTLYSFFMNNETCNNKNVAYRKSDGTLEKIYHCFYNPQSLTNLRSYINDDISTLKTYNSCQLKTSITECQDYNTKYNCENNIAYSDINLLHSKSLNLANGCLWIDSNDFNLNERSKSGICVSNFTINDEVKNIDKYKYSFRQNLIRNPSFEEENPTNYWPDLNPQNIISQRDSTYDKLTYPYQGRNYYKLAPQETISQNIENINLARAVTFYFGINAHVLENTNSTLQIRLNIDNSDTVITHEILNNVYLPNFYNEILVPENTDTLSIEIENLGDSNIYIDAISLLPVNDKILELEDFSSYFTPVQIIDSNASKCSLCLDPINAFKCDQKKASLLGDCSITISDSKNVYSSSLTNYAGKEENIYLNKRSSMSLANSLLFCEIYLDEEKCTNSNNYVNSIYSKHHYDLGNSNNLCKWNDDIGCFKDSNNDNFPDIIAGSVTTIFGSQGIAQSEIKDNYIFKNQGDGYSDFSKSCDILPPNSNFFFVALNETGDELIFTPYNVPNERIGAINIYLSSIDNMNLESCSNYLPNSENQIIIKTLIDNLESVFISDKEQLNQRGSIVFRKTLKDFLSESMRYDLDTEIVDGENNFEITISDQSGNIGNYYNFDLNIDLSPPSLIFSEDYNGIYEDNSALIIKAIIPDDKLNFEVSDTAKIDRCEYTLEAQDPATPSQFYTNSGLVPEISGEENLENLEISLPITDTRNQGDNYLYTINCFDIFNQSSNYSIAFTADYNLEIVVETPRPKNSNLKTGFIRKNNPFIAKSIENDLISCRLDFSGADLLTPNLVINSINDDPFIRNITGNLNFQTEGEKSGKIICQDAAGNSFEEELNYSVDETAPELIEGFNLIGNKTFITNDNTQYTIDLEDFEIFGKINPTGGILDDRLLINNIKSNPYEYPAHNIQIDSEDTFDNITIKLFEDNLNDVLSFADVEATLISDYVYEFKYDIMYFDLAGNNNSQELTFYYDATPLDFVFTGDIANNDGQDIYTQKNDPNIEFTLNTPEYREFSCVLEYRNDFNDLLRRDISSTNNRFSFKLSQIGVPILESDNAFEFTLRCKDQFPVTIEEDFTLRYSNQKPSIQEMFFDSGDTIYYGSDPSIIDYSDIIDNLNIITVDASNELNCELQFSSSQHIICSQDIYNFEVNSPRHQEEIKLLRGTLNSPGSYQCERIRTDDPNYQFFYNKLGTNFQTKINVLAQCKNQYGYLSNIFSKDLIIKHISGNLADLSYEYNQNEVCPIVTARSDPEVDIKIKLASTNQEILRLSNPTLSSDLVIYDGECFDITDFEEGTYPAYATSDLEQDAIISSNFIVDRTMPELEVDDRAIINNEIYSSSLPLTIIASDDNSLEKIELILTTPQGDIQIFNSQTNSFNQEYLASVPSSILPDKSLVLNVDLVNLQEETSYVLKTIVFDEVGNNNEIQTYFTAKKGIELELIDSSNSIPNQANTKWLTRTTAPIIKFETETGVSSCDLVINQEVYTITPQGSIFEFDLSQIANLDISNTINNELDILMQCIKSGETYQYLKIVSYENFIPDYILESSEGYQIGRPYETTLSIKSVSPVELLKCSYTLNNEDKKAITTEPSNQNIVSISFEEDIYESGLHQISIECEDVFGVKGPMKEYNFTLFKDASEVDILDIYFEKASNKYKLQDNSFYVNDLSDLTLVLQTNRENTQCKFTLNSYSGNPLPDFFQGILNYVTSFYDYGQDELLTENYIHRFEGINLLEDNDLKVYCSDQLLGEYNILYNESEISVSVSEINYQ